MLLPRVITAAILIPLFLGALFFLGNGSFAWLMALLLGLAAWEWAGLGGFPPAARALYAIALPTLCLGVAAAQGGAPGIAPLWAGAAGTAFWVFGASTWLVRGWEIRAQWVLAGVGVLALVPLWVACVWLQQAPGSLLAVMAVVWVADTAAYFAGRRFGQARLAPRISPGKTWAGLWGALVGVGLYAAALGLFGLLPEGAPKLSVPLAWVLAIFSVEGDLFESWLKRTRGVKDSGRILPGHGGILDRIDGLTASLPVAALYYALAQPT